MNWLGSRKDMVEQICGYDFRFSLHRLDADVLAGVVY